jgi:hypothetical protein
MLKILGSAVKNVALQATRGSIFVHPCLNLVTTKSVFSFVSNK